MRFVLYAFIVIFALMLMIGWALPANAQRREK